jgi:hypothetical protein
MLRPNVHEQKSREPIRDEKITGILTDNQKLQFIKQTPVNKTFVRAFTAFPNSAFPFQNLLNVYIQWCQQYLLLIKIPRRSPRRHFHHSYLVFVWRCCPINPVPALQIHLDSRCITHNLVN